MTRFGKNLLHVVASVAVLTALACILLGAVDSNMGQRAYEGAAGAGVFALILLAIASRKCETS